MVEPVLRQRAYLNSHSTLAMFKAGFSSLSSILKSVRCSSNGCGVCPLPIRKPKRSRRAAKTVAVNLGAVGHSSTTSSQYRHQLAARRCEVSSLLRPRRSSQYRCLPAHTSCCYLPNPDPSGIQPKVQFPKAPSPQRSTILLLPPAWGSKDSAGVSHPLTLCRVMLKKYITLFEVKDHSQHSWNQAKRELLVHVHSECGQCCKLVFYQVNRMAGMLRQQTASQQDFFHIPWNFSVCLGEWNHKKTSLEEFSQCQYR